MYGRCLKRIGINTIIYNHNGVIFQGKMKTGSKIYIRNRFLKSVILIVMTGIAVTIAATPEELFSVAVGNDIMVSEALPVTQATLESAINDAKILVL